MYRNKKQINFSMCQVTSNRKTTRNRPPLNKKVLLLVYCIFICFYLLFINFWNVVFLFVFEYGFYLFFEFIIVLFIEQ